MEYENEFRLSELHKILKEKNSEQCQIAEVGLEVLSMLLEKNRKYGSSATSPLRVFSKLEPLEGIHIRLDDKLSRIKAGAADDDEDPVFDMIGYLILEIVARRQKPDSVD